MKTLFTAFKGIHKTSFQLVDPLGANYILLTNSFQGIEKGISSIYSDDSIVYMFGVDKTLMDKIRIEAYANYNEEMVYTKFDICTLRNRFRDGNIFYTVSYKPTHYLCNAAYYHMLKKKLNTVFIHITSLKGMRMGMMNKLVKVLEDDIIH